MVTTMSSERTIARASTWTENRPCRDLFRHHDPGPDPDRRQGLELVAQIDVARHHRQCAAAHAFEHRLGGPDEVGARFEPARGTHVGIEETRGDDNRHAEDREGGEGLDEAEAVFDTP